jgi:hypothetical protein
MMGAAGGGCLLRNGGGLVLETGGDIFSGGLHQQAAHAFPRRLPPPPPPPPSRSSLRCYVTAYTRLLGIVLQVLHTQLWCCGAKGGVADATVRLQAKIGLRGGSSAVRDLGRRDERVPVYIDDRNEAAELRYELRLLLGTGTEKNLVLGDHA